jgi:hypothetical protein
VTIDLQSSTASGTATVGLWIDGNNNGTFEATDYFPFAGLTVGVVNTRQITVPLTGYTIGNPLFVRVRAFDPASLPGGSLDQLDYLGYANNGEVEDYRWLFSPTAITLDSLSARNNTLATPLVVIASTFLLTLGGFLLIRRKQTHG